MASLEDAYSGCGTWADQYEAGLQRERDAEQREREELLLVTFGFPFSEMRPRDPSNARTRDGSIHYIRKNGEHYRFVYNSTPKRWVKVD
jgi:hypothetical protein